MSVKRLLLGVLIGGALVVPSWAWAIERSSQSDPIPVGVGDIVTISGSPVGCAVRREKRQRAFDCRRIGPLAGTYGTVLTRTRVLVVRVRNRRSGTIVFTAEHRNPHARRCEVS
jgi:hypothetical protein